MENGQKITSFADMKAEEARKDAKAKDFAERVRKADYKAMKYVKDKLYKQPEFLAASDSDKEKMLVAVQAAAMEKRYVYPHPCEHVWPLAALYEV